MAATVTATIRANVLGVGVDVCGDVFAAALALHGGPGALHTLADHDPALAADLANPAAHPAQAATDGLPSEGAGGRSGGQIVTLNAEMTMAAREIGRAHV